MKELIILKADINYKKTFIYYQVLEVPKQVVAR